jgi:putative CocE/NonD family hydrolase
MVVGGWFDTENLWGALNSYAAANAHSPGHHTLVMGPWSHGQWGGDGADSLGFIGWGQNTSEYFVDSIEAPFFEYYLRGRGSAHRWESAVFETGANAWHYLNRWPPQEAEKQSLYCTENGRLSWTAPEGAGGMFDEYTNDPNNPVPYTSEIRHWYNPAFMVEDQRFASRRPDVLDYTSGVLTENLDVAGPIEVDFYVSTTGTDCDWIVKVIDVFPDSLRTPRQARRAITMGGYQMLVRGDVMRGKFRNSLANPEPFVPGEITTLRFRLNDVFHRFAKGHRVMVQVQSSWFPMIDRNPGKLIDIFRATVEDFQKTAQRVYRSGKTASRILLPVVSGKK